MYNIELVAFTKKLVNDKAIICEAKISVGKISMYTLKTNRNILPLDNLG